MALKTRVWSAGKVVVLAGALAATYVVFAFGSMRVALKSREVQVPDLRNRTASEAMTVLTDLGLTVKVDETRRPDPSVAVGRVLAQDPIAGSAARRPRTVRVWLSAGAHSATIPLLVGESQRTAELRAAQDGITLADVAEIRSRDYPSDIVIAQTPAAKSASGRVSLLINRGSQDASFVMPDLIGVNGDRASELLRNRGFRVAIVGATPYPGVVAGVVLRQSPAGGFRIAPGEPISLEVSR